MLLSIKKILRLLEVIGFTTLIIVFGLFLQSSMGGIGLVIWGFIFYAILLGIGLHHD